MQCLAPTATVKLSWPHCALHSSWFPTRKRLIYVKSRARLQTRKLTWKKRKKGKKLSKLYVVHSTFFFLQHESRHLALLNRQQFLHNTIEINVNSDKSKRGFCSTCLAGCAICLPIYMQCTLLVKASLLLST